MVPESESSSSSEGILSGGNKAQVLFDEWGRKYQYILDRLAPQLGLRWGIFSLLALVYLVRIFTISGWYIVTYGLGIYLLNQLIGFLSPALDPSMDEDDDMSLPLSGADTKEFRPFARRVPEYKFWYSCSRAVVAAFFMTFFSVFDVPVFWPILLMYFIMLFFITMKKQIMHMIKHKYVPFSFGKPSYNSGAGGKGAKDSK